MHYEAFFFLILQNQYLYSISRLFRLSPFQAFWMSLLTLHLPFFPVSVSQTGLGNKGRPYGVHPYGWAGWVLESYSPLMFLLCEQNNFYLRVEDVGLQPCILYQLENVSNYEQQRSEKQGLIKLGVVWWLHDLIMDFPYSAIFGL